MDTENYRNSFIETEICSDELCSGCGACSNICPKDCIIMMQNEWGEQHPYFRKENCISCGLCYRVCPRNNVVNKNKVISCLAGWRTDFEQRRNCSSGGVAALIAELYIRNGGAVVGTIFEREKGAHFVCCLSLDEIEDLKGSKYVHSDTGFCYRELEYLLKKDKQVVCFGTPCQIAGIRSYIKTKKIIVDDRLLLVDFLCHGTVPNDYLLKELNRIEKSESILTDTVSFRSNDADKNYYLCLYHENEIVYKVKAKKNPYFFGFLNSITTQNSCVNCDFKCKDRVGDISLGDFIGLGVKTPFEPGITDWKNPSMILVNSDFGMKVLSMLQGDLVTWERSYDEAIEGGPSLRGNVKPQRARKKFRMLYKKYGYERSIIVTTKFPMCIEYIKVLGKCMELKLKRAIKNMLSK